MSKHLLGPSNTLGNIISSTKQQLLKRRDQDDRVGADLAGMRPASAVCVGREQLANLVVGRRHVIT
jgi:hypothetical protein